jgi:hypothetical protein
MRGDRDALRCVKVSRHVGKSADEHDVTSPPRDVDEVEREVSSAARRGCVLSAAGFILGMWEFECIGGARASLRSLTVRR